MITKKVLFVFVMLVVVLSGVAIIKLWPQAALKGTFQFEGIERTYYIHIPPSYNGITPVPLVIVLHGYTETPLDIEGYSGFSTKSDKEGFIAVYPTSSTDRWNAGFGTWKSGFNDVGMINELIDTLEQEYEIDPKRIYITGFSNGAMMAYRSGAELSDRIAAIAPVAGTIGGQVDQNSPFEYISEPSQPVSVIIFHGTADASIPYQGIIASTNRYYVSVADSVAFWVRCDGCSTNPLNETSSDGSVIKSTYSNGTNGTEVVLYTLVGWSHAWPLTATDLIWDFFESHPKQ